MTGLVKYRHEQVKTVIIEKKPGNPRDAHPVKLVGRPRPYREMLRRVGERG